MSIDNARHNKDGRGTISNPDNFFKQDYQMVKKMCLSQKVRYIDDTFPPDRRSIGNNLLNPDDLRRVEWLRPRKLVPKPSFVTDGVSRFDFGQGQLGNCWFLASMGALTFQKSIFEQVVPLEQNFVQDYCGLFHFRFWRFSRWVDVIIDDKLPTLNGRLIFVHSRDPTEFWPALLEKAYAKVCGSYSDMNAGTPSEAMVDFTGGVHICIHLSEPPSNLWEIMFRARQFKSLMGCGTPQGKTSANTVLPNGLVEGHAYTITEVRQVMSRGQVVKLVRLLNPWGKGEWNGDWSDRSPLWQTVSSQDRDMCLSVNDNGEFWLSLEDFCRFYDDLDICCLCPEFLDGETPCHWKTYFYEGSWLAGKTAGGCLNFPDSFWTNPQYRITTDELDGASSAQQGDINMLVSLMQKPDKRNRALVKNLHIGFSIFEVPDQLKAQRGKFSASFFSTSQPVAQSKAYVNAREVMELIMLKPGEYLVVPSTFNANETASFILTIHSKSKSHVHENSGGHDNEHKDMEESREDDNDMKILFQKLFDKYDGVDSVLLQKLLNDKVLKGDLNNGGFSTDACRSMVAVMSTPGTGKLNAEQVFDLWTKIVMYKKVFLCTDVSKNRGLSQRELKKSIVALGIRVDDDMLNMLLLRYGTPSGHVTLESFISLAIRLGIMKNIFNRFSDGVTVKLGESEWMYISMCN